MYRIIYEYHEGSLSWIYPAAWDSLRKNKGEPFLPCPVSDPSLFVPFSGRELDGTRVGKTVHSGAPCFSSTQRRLLASFYVYACARDVYSRAPLFYASLSLSPAFVSIASSYAYNIEERVTTGQSWTQNERTTRSTEDVGAANVDEPPPLRPRLDLRSTERSVNVVRFIAEIFGSGFKARSAVWFAERPRALVWTDSSEEILGGWRFASGTVMWKWSALIEIAEREREIDRIQPVSRKNSKEVKSQRTDFRRSKKLKRSWRAREPVERPFALLWWACTVYNRHHHTTAHTGRMASNRSILGKSMINVPGERTRNLTNGEIRNEN
jgi:hypothetical protein